MVFPEKQHSRSDVPLYENFIWYLIGNYFPINRRSLRRHGLLVTLFSTNLVQQRYFLLTFWDLYRYIISLSYSPFVLRILSRASFQVVSVYEFFCIENTKVFLSLHVVDRSLGWVLCWCRGTFHDSIIYPPKQD